MTVRILVVDDEADLEALIVQKFRRQVKDGDLEFLFARDGVEALEIVTQRPDLDLVLSDINMPRMDGLKLLEALREQSDMLATVIVSAYGDMANIRIAMNRGAFDFLTKPIDLADLNATIEKTVRHVVAMRDSRARQFAAERAHAALSRFFSPNLAERLATEPGAAALSGCRREVAAMFTDIAGFTALVETLEPDVLGPLLNEYLGEMTDVVFAHGGTLAKIVGDALHVLFGAPADQDDHAARAVACALALDAHAETFRMRWREKGVPLGPTRIGINAGSAIVGNFGGQRYFDYTAYGDSINTAARLETANKNFGTRICVSENVTGRVPGFRGRPIGDLVLRGRRDALRAYEPLTEEACLLDGVRDYVSAFARLEARDPGATQSFAALVGSRPGDPLANYHLRRLLNGETGVRISVD